MKKFLFLALLLLPILASAQLDNKSPQYRVWGPTAINTQGYTSWDTLHFALKVGDVTLPKGMLLPVADTAAIPPLFSAFIINSADSIPYMGNGVYWEKIKGDATNIYTADGTLTGDRTINGGSHALTITGASLINMGFGSGSNMLIDNDSTQISYKRSGRETSLFVGGPGSDGSIKMKFTGVDLGSMVFDNNRMTLTDPGSTPTDTIFHVSAGISSFPLHYMIIPIHATAGSAMLAVDTAGHVFTQPGAGSLQEVTEVGNTTTLNVNAKSFFADSALVARDTASDAIVKFYIDQFQNVFQTMIPGVIGTARINQNCWNNFGSEIDMYGPNNVELFMFAESNVAGLQLNSVANNPAKISCGTASSGLNLYSGDPSFVPASLILPTGTQNALFNGKAMFGGVTTPTSQVDVTGTGSDLLRLRASFTPASSADPAGQVGSWAWDDGFVYVKTSAGWKRAALTAF